MEEEEGGRGKVKLGLRPMLKIMLEHIKPHNETGQIPNEVLNPLTRREAWPEGASIAGTSAVSHQYPTPTGSSSMAAVSLYSPFSRIRKALHERSCEAPRGIMHLCESMHFHLPANGRGMKSLR